LLELKLQLIDQTRLALIARPKQVALELLDHQPQIGDQSLSVRRLGTRIRQLGVAGANQLLEYLDVVGKRIISAHADDRTTTCYTCRSIDRTSDSQCRNQPAACGRHVCCGSRQSMPSNKYPSCPGVIVTVRSAPSRPAVDGQIKRPRSSRFA